MHSPLHDDCFSDIQVVAGQGCLKWADGMIDLRLGDTVMLPASLQEVEYVVASLLTVLKSRPVVGS